MLRPREKRKYPRIEAKVEVVFRTREDLVTEYTKNISLGGMFLKTDKPLDPNAEVELNLVFPDGLGEFKVSGRVVRVMSVSHPSDPGRQIYGAGIRFVNPNPEMLEAVENVVETSRGE
jgi:uncharacterized protein (TIGR02266 family)